MGVRRLMYAKEDRMRFVLCHLLHHSLPCGIVLAAVLKDALDGFHFLKEAPVSFRTPCLVVVVL